MKKIVLTLVLVCLAYCSFAQWTTGSGLIYYNGGNVGIGTTTPQTKLHVVGGEIRLAGAGTSGPASGAFISFYDSNNATRYGYLGDASSGNTDLYLNGDAGVALHFGTNAVGDRMFINTSGNVGIGTSTPESGQLVDIDGKSAIGTQASARIYLGTLDATHAFIQSRDNSISQNLNFFASAYGFNSGNLGIGTTVPLALLSVVVPSPKATVAGNVVSFLSTNDASNPFGLRTMIYGASSVASRYVTLQTTDYSLADGGNLVLQSTVGNVAIGTTDPHGFKLAVNGSAIATSMTVQLNANWPDYVFKPEYKLPALAEVKTYIDQHQHLPEIPSEAEVAKDGLNLGEMNRLLTKKVEELTLYMIVQDKQIAEQKAISEKEQREISELREQVGVLVKAQKNQ